MSGINDFLDGVEGAADAGAPDPVVETPQAAAPVADAPVDLDGDLTGTTFDRPYVERLRKEAAGHRTRAKQYEDAFEGYGDDERDGLFQLARMLRDDPKSAAEEMKAAYEAIMEQYKEPAVPEFDPESDPNNKFMTMADYKKLQDDAAVAAETKMIEVEARELGYTVNPNDVDYRLLLLVAQNSTKTGSLKEAHDIIQGRNQKVIDTWVAAKASDAGGPKPPADTAQIPGSAEPIRSFKDSRAALENFIAQQRGQM